MLKLILGNSYSQVVGLTPVHAKRLKALLSFDPAPDAGRYVPGFRPKLRYLIDAKGSFPSGLLGDVLDFLLNQGLGYRVDDQRDKTFSAEVPGFPKATLPYQLYPAQLEAIEAAVMNMRGILSLPTGVGKSLVIAGLIARLKVRTLVVVPNLSLKVQLTETLEQVFGKTSRIRVENIDSTALSKLKDFGLLIIDEAHHAAANTYHKLNKTAWNGISYRCMLTATPYRNRDNEQIMFKAIAGDILYQLSYADAIANGYIVPVTPLYLDVPPKETAKTTWAAVYSDLVVNNEQRNQMIALMLLRLNAERKATLCLVKEIAHGKILSEMTGVPFINGQDEESRQYLEQFNSGKIKALIGTTGVIGEGCDTKPCEFVIIAGLGKAKSAFLQQVGRAVRVFPDKDSAKVVLFKDVSHRWCLTHFREQSKILAETFGVKPVKVEL